LRAGERTDRALKAKARGRIGLMGRTWTGKFRDVTPGCGWALFHGLKPHGYHWEVASRRGRI